MKSYGRRARRWRLACVALLVTCASTTGVSAGQVRPVNIEEMTARAASIFAGRCVEVSSLSDEASGGDVTLATFQVLRSVKGDARGTVTVRLPEAVEVAGYRQGDEVVLFLYGESALGFRAPVGLGQGRFRVHTGKHGRPVAVNELGNRNLMRGLSEGARARVDAIASEHRDAASLAPTELLDIAAALAAQAP